MKKIAVLGGGIQSLLFGQLVVRLVRVGFGGLAVVVPDAEDAAHGDVQLAVRGLVHLVGQLQHGQDAVIHLHGGFAGVVVDGFNVIYTIIIIVNIKQLMIFLHGIFCQMLIFRKLFLTLRADCNAGNGIKIIQILGTVRCHLLAAA